MEEFEKKAIDDVVVEIVNLSRATFKEATEFKKILNEDLEKKFKKVVVDISQCEFMDSTFLGVLVYAQKRISTQGGEIKLVEPASVFQTLLEKTSTLRIFDTHKSVDGAVKSFSKQFVNASKVSLTL
ncbi:MAG: STAS domain-containing protein [Ignavibacteria bacterium]|nr:STAS domain-containing protein [Ignavibacteria bacterium]MBT8382971.1 STAS domain-containing protein [Ignavibacteria bacterium]MBT8391926.1 STAS domain-containing protein [Ignavibacteria bacterium]NNJ52457.1 STAS domain-containing protein [Ignavibacteriaceae bacterium]NNL22341.1 STAS domain-containing protein [Ignavibacteriaceae bacterium]